MLLFVMYVSISGVPEFSRDALGTECALRVPPSCIFIDGELRFGSVLFVRLRELRCSFMSPKFSRVMSLDRLTLSPALPRLPLPEDCIRLVLESPA